jgi:hypothetical protein
MPSTSQTAERILTDSKVTVLEPILLNPSKPLRKAPPMDANTKVGAKTERALLALASGAAKTQTAAAKLAGMSREQLQRNLGKVHVAARLDQLLRAAMRTDAVAAQNTVRSLTKSARSEFVRLQASQDTLDRAGYSPDALAAVGRGSGVKITIDLG